MKVTGPTNWLGQHQVLSKYETAVPHSECTMSGKVTDTTKSTQQYFNSDSYETTAITRQLRALGFTPCKLRVLGITPCNYEHWASRLVITIGQLRSLGLLPGYYDYEVRRTITRRGRYHPPITNLQLQGARGRVRSDLVQWL
jgi:hypothetical protein